MTATLSMPNVTSRRAFLPIDTRQSLWLGPTGRASIDENIAITLIDPTKGEETAQACANAC